MMFTIVLLTISHFALCLIAYCLSRVAKEDRKSEFIAVCLLPLLGPILAIITYLEVIGNRKELENYKKSRINEKN